MIWKSNYLLFGGRTTSIKAVLSNLPIDHLLLFKVPKWVAIAMKRMRNQFLRLPDFEAPPYKLEVCFPDQKQEALGFGRPCQQKYDSLGEMALAFSSWTIFSLGYCYEEQSRNYTNGWNTAENLLCSHSSLWQDISQTLSVFLHHVKLFQTLYAVPIKGSAPLSPL